MPPWKWAFGWPKYRSRAVSLALPGRLPGSSFVVYRRLLGLDRASNIHYRWWLGLALEGGWLRKGGIHSYVYIRAASTVMCTFRASPDAAEGGTQFLPLVLFLSFSLEGCWSKYPAAGLERPVYIGLEIYWTPGLFGTANFHWSVSHLHSGKAGTLPSAWLMWGRWSQESAGLLLLELLRADWPSAYHE